MFGGEGDVGRGRATGSDLEPEVTGGVVDASGIMPVLFYLSFPCTGGTERPYRKAPAAGRQGLQGLCLSFWSLPLAAQAAGRQGLCLSFFGTASNINSERLRQSSSMSKPCHPFDY